MRIAILNKDRCQPEGAAKSVKNTVPESGQEMRPLFLRQTESRSFQKNSVWAAGYALINVLSMLS